MARLIVYFAHPGLRFSRANGLMARIAAATDGVTFVDLLADYPRYAVDVDREQRRLTEHDVILLQFPLFWYSTPSILKEWQDLVLEHGWAYGTGGDALAGKRMMLAVTAGGPRDAYAEGGYNRYPLRTLLTPLEQTARLCGMDFGAPYVLFGAVRAEEDGTVGPHVEGYGRLIEAIRDDRFDFGRADGMEVVTCDDLPIGSSRPARERVH